MTPPINTRNISSANPLPPSPSGVGKGVGSDVSGSEVATSGEERSRGGTGKDVAATGARVGAVAGVGVGASSRASPGSEDMTGEVGASEAMTGVDVDAIIGVEEVATGPTPD